LIDMNKVGLLEWSWLAVIEDIDILSVKMVREMITYCCNK